MSLTMRDSIQPERTAMSHAILSVNGHVDPRGSSGPSVFFLQISFLRHLRSSIWGISLPFSGNKTSAYVLHSSVTNNGKHYTELLTLSSFAMEFTKGALQTADQHRRAYLNHSFSDINMPGVTDSRGKLPTTADFNRANSLRNSAFKYSSPLKHTSASGMRNNFTESPVHPEKNNEHWCWKKTNSNVKNYQYEWKLNKRIRIEIKNENIW